MPTDASSHKAMTQVVVTRPEQDASAWVDSLNEAGFKTIRFPLLALTDFLTNQTALEALVLLKRSQAVMFVSANAVRFLAQALRHQPDWVDHFQIARAWCTGPGTAAALAQCGIPLGQIDQPSAQARQLDSEALWEVVASQVVQGMNVLFVRGADESGAVAGRDWLALALEQANIKVSAIAAYQRTPAQLTEAQKAQVQQYIADGAIWVFSSSAALQALVAQCPQVDWSMAKATVTHPRMADLAQKMGWGAVAIAPPGLSSLQASIKSLA
ncbi:MAG: uroporphyrinogen-III synthase [Betaproteobacteria bacterium]